MSYKSRLPQIAAELAGRMDALTKTTAEIVDQGEERAPVATGKLRNAIHVEREGVGEHMVIAGDTKSSTGTSSSMADRTRPLSRSSRPR